VDQPSRQLADGTLTVTLTWYVCDLKTGVVLNTLPLHVAGTVERSVGAPSTLGVRLDVHDARCPADWEALLDKRRTMLVLDDDGAPLVGYRIVFYAEVARVHP
jgi:hypothetical protein